MIGDLKSYAMFHQYVPKFRSLFPVKVEFDSRCPINGNEGFIREHIKGITEGLGVNITDGALVTLAEEAIRESGHHEKISVFSAPLEGIVQQARAHSNGSISSEDIQKAIESHRKGIYYKNLLDFINSGVRVKFKYLNNQN